MTCGGKVNAPCGFSDADYLLEWQFYRDTTVFSAYNNSRFFILN